MNVLVGEKRVETYLSCLILSCLQKINGERTTYSIYHLLKGKKSSQTIQDAHLFNMTNLFQTFPQLSRNFFEEIIRDLNSKNYIQIVDVDKYKITTRGMAHLEQTLIKMPIPGALNGWKYHSIQEDFWKRLTLLIQVCSNLINYNSSYIPIQNDNKTSDWVKEILIKLSKKREELSNELLQEVINCLNTKDEIMPEVVVWRLTGHKQIGLTSVQVAELFKMDMNYFHLHFLSTIHYMIDRISASRNQYPILQNLLIDYQKPIVLTNSSLVTYRYLQLGYNIDEIASARNLKNSTIEDHIVEIALNETDFSLEPFVPIEVEHKIRVVIQKLNSKQLKMIRQELKENISYFQIRLVQARLGEPI
ncbi:helix-turn-helix domain-containing protein [Pseudoneobacillus rhizosphaerae]|nr:helix-turn-helix domain-containing protein [Pseudoneobacillus rhizosphaerae]